MIGKLGKKEKSVITIYGIVLFVYVMAFIIIPFYKNGASWMTFIFTIIAIIGSLVINGYAFNCKNPKEVIYGFPIFRIGIIYLIAQFVIGIAICIVNTFFNMPAWIVLLISIVMMGVAAICVILAINTRDVVMDVDNSIEETKQLSLFNVCIAGIVDSCKDEALKNDLEELENMFKYSSDPVSNDSTKDIEEEIEVKLKELQESISMGTKDAKSKVEVVKNLLKERNRLCQINKK